MSAAVPLSMPPPLRVLPPGVPPDAVRHLGVTPAQILALEVLNLTFIEAVTLGILKLPPPLTAESLPGYLATIKEWVELGLDPNEPHDEAGMVKLERAKAEGLVPEIE